jgi:hypothetical protein
MEDCGKTFFEKKRFPAPFPKNALTNYLNQWGCLRIDGRGDRNADRPAIASG